MTLEIVLLLELILIWALGLVLQVSTAELDLGLAEVMRRPLGLVV